MCSHATRTSTHLPEGAAHCDSFSSQAAHWYVCERNLRTRFVHWTKPLTSSLPLGTLADLARSKSELIAENALLRQQLIMLKRQVKRPACTKSGSVPPRALSKGGSGLETSALHRSTRHPAAVAS